MSPQRIQLRRTRSWRLPDGAVVVARPTRWGNPIKVGTPVVDQDTGLAHAITAVEAVATYRAALLSGRLGMYGGAEITADVVRRELAGRDLACWCPLDQACHADVLLELANPPSAEGRALCRFTRGGQRHPADARYTPCCSSHGADLCCRCYRLTHFVETGCDCCPDGITIRAAMAASAAGGVRS
ncbi:MAG TPA: DUF4326 domain-containing protein [Kineosporiaceae bacterium]